MSAAERNGESRRRVTVELEEGAGPIRGSLDLGDGDPRAFSGWLELASALEALRPARDRGILAMREAAR
jgi:hypothetical protein